MLRLIVSFIVFCLLFPIWAADIPVAQIDDQQEDQSQCVTQRATQCIDRCQTSDNGDCIQMCTLVSKNECRYAGE